MMAFSKIESLDLTNHNTDEKRLLQEVCVNHESDITLISSLLKARKDRVLLRNKRGLQKYMESVLEEHLNPNFADYI